MWYVIVFANLISQIFECSGSIREFGYPNSVPEFHVYSYSSIFIPITSSFSNPQRCVLHDCTCEFN